MRNCFLPPKIADKLHSQIGHPPELDKALRGRREVLSAPVLKPGQLKIYTAKNRQVEPGTPETVLDIAGQEAYSGLDATVTVLELLRESFGADGLVATVHYGSGYDNAFWDGSQMVFGDGDGQIFGRFTKPIDVCAHELGHGVTGDLLNYQDEAGALNESMSDAQGATVRQHALGLSPTDPEAWLIGSKQDLGGPAFTGRALRDMLNPGTAFRNDPNLGDDDQPAKYSDYLHTRDDDGGVHTNSGIPNRAFALAAQGVGDSIKLLGIWRAALSTVNNPACTFKEFAGATVMAAQRAFGVPTADIVQGAWVTVEVLDAKVSGGGAPSNDGPFPGADPAVGKHILAAAHRAGVTPRDWMNHHFRTYFRIR